MQDYHSILKLVRSVADKAKLDLKFIEHDAVPHTNGKVLCVPQPNPLWNADEWAMWIDGVYHETGHNMPENRDAFECVTKNKIDMGSIFGKGLNIIDDYRVDRNRCKAYYGMREAQDKVMPKLVRRQAESPFPFGKGNAKQNKEMEIIWVLKAFDVYCRGATEFPIMRGMDSLFTPHFTENCHKWFSKLVNEYTEKYTNNITAEQELEVLTDIFINVFECDPEENGKGSGAGEGEGDEDSNGEGEEENESNNKSNGDKPSDEDGDGESTKDIVINYDDLLRHPVGNDGIKAEPGSMRIEYDSDRVLQSYEPHTDSTQKIFDCYKGEFANGFSSFRASSENDINIMLKRLNVGSMTGQARRLLQAETRKRPHFNQKRGRLDTSKIFRVTMPENSASERIFKTKEVSKALDTAVTLLVDYSGSMMCESKIDVAVASAVALSNLLNTLRVSTEVLGFTECYDTCKNYLYVFKPFSVNVPEERLVESMSKASSVMSNNADGDSILIAQHRLLQQKNPRKVLIVLSDGSPAGSRGDADGFTQKVIKNIEGDKNVDIIGIGIKDDNVERLYKHHKVVWDIEKLPEVLIQTLESVILEKK